MFQLMAPDKAGVSRFGVLPGLWLDELAFLAGRHSRALARLEEGLASEEFRAFQQAHTKS